MKNPLQTKINNMQYKKLNSNGTKWINCKYDSSKKEIPLYENKGTEENPNFVIFAIGLY